ncbi:putative amidase [Actinacidiphila reveromycinica]|uniref:Putative amidase n=1 Tax=Actinacidiphila reveromycinica TaxID=659352 RepID=A0A7U3UUH9_9ACTN|nr:amidase [Streptomyces sp. SN-593]BBA98981.1 putative amidase [Streptomyces sp. SN-593]
MTDLMAELLAMPARRIARAVRDGELSPVEIAEATAARIDRLDASLHAFCTRADEVMLRQARALQRRLARGEPVGALAGVPLAVKDLIATRGIRTAAGTPAYRDFVPDEDDVVVRRAVAAGALVAGKTNVSELGYGGVGHNPVFPTTRNPWNPALTSGGSSAGSAVAVATGMTPLALGSDGGGSVRSPASFCGVVGIKPSMGRVPLYPGCRDPRFPGLSGWESVEHIGPLARGVDDAALLLSVIAGPDPRDRHSIPCGDVDWGTAAHGDVRGLRIGFSEDWGHARVDPRVREVLRGAARVFEDTLGCHVEEVDVPWGRETLDVYATIVAHDTDLTGMRDLVRRHGDRMSPHLVELVRRDWRGAEFTDALMARQRLCNQVWPLMERYDLLLTPVVAVPPFAVGRRGPETIDGHPAAPEDWSPFTFVANLTGLPAASVPAALTPDGLPVGVHLLGGHLADAVVLRAAACFEAAVRAPTWLGRRAAAV